MHLTLTVLPSGRYDLNPERGRKLEWKRFIPAALYALKVDMTSTPRGDGNLRVLDQILKTGSSKVDMTSTPRGDGNRDEYHSIAVHTCRVDMTSTPRGDGNLRVECDDGLYEYVESI